MDTKILRILPLLDLEAEGAGQSLEMVLACLQRSRAIWFLWLLLAWSTDAGKAI
jgi:hypothetical protein